MTLQDYRDDEDRIEFAKQVAQDNDWDAAYVREHFVDSHQGQHVACLTCALVAVYFDVEIVIKTVGTTG